MSNEKLGIVDEGVRRRALYERDREPLPGVAPPRPILVVKPIFEKGRYIPASLANILCVVARLAEIETKAICGQGKRRPLVDARFTVANLAEEFASQHSCNMVDDAMLRGQGLTRWYRERHRDRLENFPTYRDLYHRCQAEMAK